MFRKILLLFIFFSSIIFSNLLDVPEKIQKSLLHDFGRIRIYSCEYKATSNSYILTIKKDTKFFTIYYSPTGKLIKKIEPISLKSIPLKVRNKIFSLASKENIGYYKKVTSGNNIYYKIFVFDDDGETIYNISTEGKVIKKTLVVEEDDMGC